MKRPVFARMYCQTKFDAKPATIARHDSCKGSTGYNNKTGQMGKVDIEVDSARGRERRTVEARPLGPRMCFLAIWRRIGRQARFGLADGFTLRDAAPRIESLT